MTEYDDALLEDDILSLPDVNSDEEYDFNQIKPKDASNNFVDLRIFDAFKESMNEEENNIRFKTKQLSNCNTDFYNQQKTDEMSCNNKDKLVCHKNNNSEFKVEPSSINNNVDYFNTDSQTSLKNNIQNHKEVIASFTHDINDNLSNLNTRNNNAYKNNNFERHQLLNTQIHLHQLWSDQNKPDTVHQSFQNYQQPGSQFIPGNINYITNASFTPFEHNQHYTSSFNQPYYLYDNQNVYFNHGVQYLPLQNCMHLLNPHLTMKNILPFNELSPTNSVFAQNQTLSMNQTLPFSQGLSSNHYLQSSIMTSGVITSNQYMPIMGNTYSSIPQYSESSYVQRLLNYNNNQQNIYLMNPVQIHNNLNIHKILINRHFTQNITRKEVTNNPARYEELSKNNLSKTTYLESNNPSQNVKTQDPYSYFSDVWQQQTIKKEINKRSTSPEVDSKIINKQSTEKCNKRKLRKQFQRLRRKLGRKNNITLNNKTNINKGKNKKKKSRSRINQIKELQVQMDGKIDNNNNKNEQNSKIKSGPLEIPIKEKILNSEMEDYCKKVEEQRKLRKIFWEQKEERRKILAMEKLGIKKESFTNSIG